MGQMMFKYITDIKDQLVGLDSKQKRGLLLLAGTMFTILFSYPLIRAVSTAVFLDAFGAKKSPLVWIYSVVGLSVVIFFYNKLQKRVSVHKIFVLTALFTTAFFILSSFLIKSHLSLWAYPLFIWKEIYIVLLIHTALAYLNNYVDFELAKIVYGPVGALGSIGGVLGGLLTSYLTHHFSLGAIINFAAAATALAAYFFWSTRDSQLESVLEKKNKKSESPLRSILDVKEYVLMIALVVTFSQFVINLGNFRFNQIFSLIVPDKIEKARYLGQIYSAINMISLIIQVCLMPFLYKKIKLKHIHVGIPLSYLGVCFFGFVVAGGALISVAFAFVYLKGTDYSLFSASKELLYFPLSPNQKYGAKYIVDMIVYRFAKGLISLFLIVVQSASMINALFVSCIVIWSGLVMRLFQVQQKQLIKTKGDSNEHSTTR